MAHGADVACPHPRAKTDVFDLLKNNFNNVLLANNNRDRGGHVKVIG